jgi:hypothetical protein
VALVKDVYPAYITWEEHERIQETIAKNWRLMQERMSRQRGKHTTRPLLRGLAYCGHCGHAMRVAYKARWVNYVCAAAQAKHARPSCQFLSGHLIDEAVVQEFFRVLQSAEIDALEHISARGAAHQREVVRHLEQDVARLDYAAQKAERQYNHVDPENRLIAATLERKWELALADLEQARQRLKDAQAAVPKAIAVPRELRAVFADIGHQLPEAWPGLSCEAQRQLLRTLITAVNLRRDDEGMVQVRIVWKGGFVSEQTVRVPIHSLRFAKREQQIVERIRELIEKGMDDSAIARTLDEEGYSPCRGGAFTERIVLKLRCRYKVPSLLARLRQGNLPEGYTVRELTELIGVDSSWFYHRIGEGTLQIARTPRYGHYLFPRSKRTIQQLKQLRNGKIHQLSFLSEHHDG